MAEITIDGLRYEIFKRTKTARVKNVAQGYKSQGSFTILPSVKFEGELLRVTEIGDEAFRECKAVTISIPDTITHIGSKAFYYCSSLTSVTLGSGVTSIGKQAFYGCSGLTSITIPESVTSIGNGAFWGCSGLTSIVVEEGNSTYDSRDNCNAIIETTNNTLIRGCQNTTIPNSVTSIGEGAFARCYFLTSITIPESVTSIGDEAFYDCIGLTSITIPNSVTSIGKGAFANCYGLTSITIPNSVTSIGSWAFHDCIGLTSITISNSVTSIGNGAFSWCSSLTSITIPYSVTTIGKGALKRCDKLDTIIIENTPENITFDFANNSDDQWISKVQFVGQPENVEQLKAAAAARVASAAQKAAPKEAATPAETPTAEPAPAPATPVAAQPAETPKPAAPTINLETLIAAALVDGIVTDKERAILCKKVKEAGGDVDEFEMLLDARIYEAQQKNQPAPAPKAESCKADMEGMINESPATSPIANRVIHGAWTLELAEDKSVKMYKNGELCEKTSPALRELAAEVGFTYDPGWNTRQFGSKLFAHLKN